MKINMYSSFSALIFVISKYGKIKETEWINYVTCIELSPMHLKKKNEQDFYVRIWSEFQEMLSGKGRVQKHI